DFDANKNLYSWNLYKHKIKEAEDEEKLFSTANFIINNTRQERYSAYERTVLEVLKHLKNKPNTNYNQMLYWTEKLDPRLLSQDTFSFTDDNGRKRELASSLESWYQYRIKALDRKSTRLNSSHVKISYAVFCLKKKKEKNGRNTRNRTPIEAP